MKERIKEIRKTLRLSQGKFAETLNVSGNFIWMVEKGERSLSDRTIADICRQFNVSEDWLRTGEGEMFSQAVKKDEVAALVENVLSKRFAQLKEEIMQSLDGLTDEELETIGKVFDNLSETKKE